MRACLTFACLFSALMTTAFAEDEYKLSAVEKLNDGYDAKIVAALDEHGVQIAGKDGPVCTVWLAKSLVAKPSFKPTLTIKYPLTAGNFVGAMQVHGTFADFRAQTVKPGLYTLRYGTQPQDGNHVGTNELSDFLCAVPADTDTDPAPVKVPTLMKRSAKSTGSNHPAIYSLLPPNEKAETPSLSHDAAKELWVLNLAGVGKQGDKEIKVPIRVVVIGKSEG
jgi:hypothetical protein